MSARRRPVEDAYGRVQRPHDAGTAGLGLWSDAPPAPTPAAPAQVRREKARVLDHAGWRRWIDVGKPIALLVAAQDTTVTAETFRLAAEQMPHALPPTYGQDRTLSYLSAMFAELVAEGHLRKRTRDDGSVVKRYSEASRNEHVVYELVHT